METYYLVTFECNLKQHYEVTTDFEIAKKFDIIDSSSDEKHIYNLKKQHTN